MKTKLLFLAQMCFSLGIAIYGGLLFFGKKKVGMAPIAATTANEISKNKDETRVQSDTPIGEKTLTKNTETKIDETSTLDGEFPKGIENFEKNKETALFATRKKKLDEGTFVFMRSELKPRLFKCLKEDSMSQQSGLKQLNLQLAISFVDLAVEIKPTNLDLLTLDPSTKDCLSGVLQNATNLDLRHPNLNNYPISYGFAWNDLN